VHRLATSFVLGYHGCDEAVAEAILAGKAFKQSQNDYDWLGPGVYFWEANPLRGLDFAKEVAVRRPNLVKNPTVIGAVIDLGLCLDTTTKAATDMLAVAYQSLLDSLADPATRMPQNGADLRMRRLDCAVVGRLHAITQGTDLEADTVRGVFVEGEPIYQGSGFHAKTHSQIAVRNQACIKGVFRVPKNHLA
jgi:hypothetical protein